MRGKIPKNDLNAFILARNQTGTGLIDAQSGRDIHALQQLRQAKLNASPLSLPVNIVTPCG